MKFHVIGYIAAENKNPQQILAVANPVKFDSRNQPILPTFDVLSDSECFIGPYDLDWFNIIDKYQCDKDLNEYHIWEPDMSEFLEQEVSISGQKLKGHIRKDLAEILKKMGKL